ncbi:MAG: hypothetical protein HY235_29135 [Acidobacteria bacterium]|nr:hypothetical protein [Acidobacteriota bacterium]
MPEQIECEHAIEASQTGESLVCERTVDQEMRGFVLFAQRLVGHLAAMPRLEQRKIVQERQTRVGDQPAGIQAAQSELPAQRIDRTIARRRAHQVHALKLLAEPQIGDASVRDSSLPGHVECPQIRQMAHNLQTAVCKLAARVLAQIEMLQLRHASQVLQAIIGELPRTT